MECLLSIVDFSAVVFFNWKICSFVVARKWRGGLGNQLSLMEIR